MNNLEIKVEKKLDNNELKDLVEEGKKAVPKIPKSTVPLLMCSSIRLCFLQKSTMFSVKSVITY